MYATGNQIVPSTHAMDQHHQPPVPPSNPFEGDLLDRQPTVERYTALLEQAERPCVLALNGGWGAGKTTFIGFWEKYLGDRGTSATTCNVWKQGSMPRGVSNGILFIDELDRCLPPFVVEFLHYLEFQLRAGNTACVLAINRREIEKSLRSAYGEEFDVAGYMRRLFDYERNLPNEECVRKKFVLEKCKMLDVPASRDKVSKGEKDYARGILADFLSISDLEIRDIVQILSHLQSVFQVASTGPLDYALFTACFLVLRVFEPELYDKFTRREISDADVYDQFRHLHGEGVHPKHQTEFWAALTAVVICWKSPGLTSEGCERSRLWRRFQEKRVFADRVRAILRAYRDHIEVDDVIQRIGSLTGKFKTG